MRRFWLTLAIFAISLSCSSNDATQTSPADILGADAAGPEDVAAVDDVAARADLEDPADVAARADLEDPADVAGPADVTGAGDVAADGHDTSAPPRWIRAHRT